ncbi:MAG: F0F1 ATP synthase subunit alpha [Thermoanaerobacteraceae bacterium]|nr:F0F1 ATP synthase subunit alpha [Thermoanaerobacteraceae bacterium]
MNKELYKKINKYQLAPKIYNIGYVEEIGDSIANVSGLSACKYGELLRFEDSSVGIAMNLERDRVGVVLLDNDHRIVSGSRVISTGQVLQVKVGDALIGRVVDALGQPLDGKGEIKESGYRPVEVEAPKIIERVPVNRPLETGLTMVDAIVPIGRGQRELIIGDRQTGKTTIAVDTILNQKGKDVICIYVAIGQKTSSIAQLVQVFEQHKALDYTFVVCATASDPAPLQYLVPYSATAMAEEFMYQGKDVLIVYDDLSKHAVAYREMSLLLRRPPGREAFPGDVFYLHSRLLERAAQLAPEKGGGSITALPIVETMEGDISAYIPTNIISITDGQIYLEAELFHAGIRPAINVGLSVSRVGGAAQSPAMKKVSSQLRLELAQYRELSVFAQFGSDLDASTQAILDYGAKLTEILKQNKHNPLSLPLQVITLFIASNKYLAHVPLAEVKNYLQELLHFIEVQHPEIVESIANTKELDAATESRLHNAIEEFRLSKGS